MTQRRFLISLFCAFLLVLAFLYRDRFVYYYRYYFEKTKHESLKNSAFETRRINRIIHNNSDKTFGFDISHYQRKEHIDWNNLMIGDNTIQLQFVILRATMGNTSKDKHFEHFWEQAKESGLICGAYHFYRPDGDPVKQAEVFIDFVKLEKGDLRPVLDIEKMPRRKSREQYISDVKTWLRLVEEAYGVKPIIYTYYHFYKDYLRGNGFEEYPLWLANYNDVEVPSEQDEWMMWQFTENGIVSGINTKIDLNVFNGSVSELKNLTID